MGIIDGIGILKSDSTLYLGEFKRGEFSGWGTYIDFQSLSLYAGEFAHNAKHGLGKCQIFDQKSHFSQKIEGLTKYEEIDVENYQDYIGEMLNNLSSLLLKIWEKLEQFKKSAEVMKASLEQRDSQTENYLRKKVKPVSESKKEAY